SRCRRWPRLRSRPSGAVPAFFEVVLVRLLLQEYVIAVEDLLGHLLRLDGPGGAPAGELAQVDPLLSTLVQECPPEDAKHVSTPVDRDADMFQRLSQARPGIIKMSFADLQQLRLGVP